jgi:hypothetical protein
MTITPDTKDWTWVLDRPCPECGYDAASLTDEGIAPAVRDNAAAWRGVAADTRRPHPQTWSPLEYACHVRDVHVLFRKRVELMLAEDDPLFANWDQDETALEQRYAERDPAQVVAELEQAADRLADAFAALDEEQWTRTGRRSNGSVFTVSTLARYYLHDVVHHRHDVGA